MGGQPSCTSGPMMMISLRETLERPCSSRPLIRRRTPPRRKLVKPCKADWQIHAFVGSSYLSEFTQFAAQIETFCVKLREMYSLLSSSYVHIYIYIYVMF